MKFKVTKKDFYRFCIYSVILLYFCAIAVLNFYSLINEGKPYGLLPFKAFTGDFLIITLTLFIAVLIIVFGGVSELIFSREKKGSGWGLLHLVDNNTDGYSDWASEKDIKNDAGVAKVISNATNINAAGIPLINHGREMWVDNGEYHNLIIGSSGSGKTQCVVKPLVTLLSKKGESMVITDPKGEIYEGSAAFLKQQGYKIIVLNFREPSMGNSWNPLTLPYLYYKEGKKDKGIELLEDVALNILYDKESNADPFWEKSAADYFSALSLGLFMDASEKQINLNSINVMSTVGEERRGANTYVKEYFLKKGVESPAYIFASNTVNAPNETKGGILSTFRQKIRQFSTKESLSEMLSYSDFDMRQIGKERTAVFMLIHDEKKTYHGLMTIFIKQCYECLIDCAQQNGGKLSYRTNFILDEFANMPPLKDVDAMVTAARSRDIRFTFIIQNFAQLNDVYGEQVAEIIKGNCGNLVYLISTEMKALEEISKMCGEVKSKEKDKTASTPLITISDLQKLKLFEAIIRRVRLSPFKTKLAPDFKTDWGIPKEKATIPSREEREVEIFDLKQFVAESSKDDQMNGMGGMMPGGGNPFMGGGFNPFSSPMPSGGNPFSSSSMGGSPFGPSSIPKPSSNPFADLSSGLPSPSAPSSSSMDSIGNMDIDSIVKDIEAKLKELDEEEAAEKKALEEKNAASESKKEDINVTELQKPLDKPNFSIEEALKQIEDKETPDASNEEPELLDLTQEIKLDDINKPVINVDKDSVVVNENVVTDDEFYDDFFDE